MLKQKQSSPVMESKNENYRLCFRRQKQYYNTFLENTFVLKDKKGMIRRDWKGMKRVKNRANRGDLMRNPESKGERRSKRKINGQMNLTEVRKKQSGIMRGVNG